MELELHSIVKLFPEMAVDEFSYLVNDIREHGQLEPISVIAETNQVIDGRHRLKACLELGIEPKIREVACSDEYDVICYVRSANATRRHLDAGQRAAVAAEMMDLLKEAAHKRQLAGLKQFAPAPADVTDVAFCHDGLRRSRDIAAAAMQVSSRYVGSANKVRKADQEVFARVKAGQIELQDGLKLIKTPDEMRARAIGKMDAGEKDARKAISAVRLEIVKEHEHELPDVPENCRLFVCDVAKLAEQIEPGSIDSIITDPPFPKEYLPCFGKLAELAATVLRPGGSLVVMAPHIYLPEIFSLMTPFIRYMSTIAMMMPGSTTRIRLLSLNNAWRPVLWYCQGGKYSGKSISDVVKSNASDKRFHDWGQSESGMGALITQFSEPGDLVLDPFLGGGTTAVRSLALGRRFIGADIDDQAILITRSRLAEVAQQETPAV
ncbi:MAG: DNA methyltransferase [Thermacetogeniaceae bacterium]